MLSEQREQRSENSATVLSEQREQRSENSATVLSERREQRSENSATAPSKQRDTAPSEITEITWNEQKVARKRLAKENRKLT